MTIARTSLEAHAKTDSAAWRKRVYAWLYLRKDGTLFEACGDLGRNKNALSGRFTELRSAGMIRRNGERRTDPETGCSAYVWEVVR